LQRKDWEQGALAQAFLEAGDMEQVILFSKAALVLKVPDGRMAVVGAGSPTDPAMGGEAYWRAGQVTGDAALQQAVEDMLQWLLDRAPRAQDGTLYHVFQRPEVWADGFNGAPPFLAATGHYDEALRQIDGFKRRLWNPEKKLLAHIASDDKKLQAVQPELWGSGNGWAAVGVARVIRALPADRDSDRKRLAEFVRDIVDGCLAYQLPGGLFHNIVDRPETFVETNLAQMLAFAIYTGIAGGWLPASYLEAANRMRKAAEEKVDSFGFVQGVCGAPGFNSSGVSTEGQAFFLMMETAAAKQAEHS
jgi:rhamnogalacturonyl hydrolase YesR